MDHSVESRVVSFATGPTPRSGEIVLLVFLCYDRRKTKKLEYVISLQNPKDFDMVPPRTGVTENKYSLEKSTPGVLFSQEISTPQYSFPRKKIPPLGNLYSPKF